MTSSKLSIALFLFIQIAFAKDPNCDVSNKTIKQIMSKLKSIKKDQCGLKGNFEERAKDCSWGNKNFIMISRVKSGKDYYGIYKDLKTGLIWSDHSVKGHKYKDAIRFCKSQLSAILNTPNAKWRLPHFTDLESLKVNGAEKIFERSFPSWSTLSAHTEGMPPRLFRLALSARPFTADTGYLQDHETAATRCVIGQDPKYRSLALGQECKNRHECESDYCRSVCEMCAKQTCAPKGQDGSRCKFSGECASDFCYKNKCTPIPGQVTPASLKTGSKCDSGQSCKSGWCKGGKCAELLPIGTECYSSESCNSKLCVNNICSASNKNGEKCDSNFNCSSGNCINGVCSSTATIGATCLANFSCGSGYCDNGVCKNTTPDGSKCDTGYSCNSKWCVSNVCMPRSE